ncbi:dTMP kinase [Candidatus Kaiserbacteria bacterium RIFCSPHIGHO2_02_FULL_55_20]|uniref:Thymidylate kinase n=1 Tax=Candidatus Kaiserbacteria bacterium RIFCSPHIGHO2_02_FULL_55_20 TaxID=1798497 RepID=A0A1F6DW96_9BACT|nr:MAG: dTMP kinase [Candidatus Kaiserbacteria bacterium RIFCSPHIGHO2_01_FULL_55_37]OGG65688.1 MAG: dTMP kinase [Candidatus Kaiserbacteria bacterium RIFCSPHIGHO2_02_FULL_55_20]
MSRGKFIVFEGGEGSGKSVLMERLRATLPDAVFTRYPGGSPIGEKIRELVLSKEAQGIDTATELLLFLAARAQLIADVIEPALAAGKTVVCDRFELSTMVYQVYGREKPEYRDFLFTVSKTINKGCVPDATIFLDVTPEVGLARAHARPEEPNRFDNEQLAFHERVREGYRKHVVEYPHFFIIDADKPLEEVWRNIEETIQSVVSKAPMI